MKYKVAGILFVSFCVIFALANLGQTLPVDDVDKAKQFMATEMYDQAIEVLIKHVEEVPTDAEAHYLLGVCYIQLGDFSEADRYLANAGKLGPDYGPKIGREYKQAGIDTLIKGDFSTARTLFERAVKYHVDLKEGIARTLMSRQAFDAAIAIDPSRRPEVAAKLYEQSQQVKGEERISLIKKSIKYGGKYQAELGKAFLDAAMENAGTEKGESYAQEAVGYVPMEAMAEFDVAHLTKKHPEMGKPKEIEISDDQWHLIDESVSNGDKLLWISPVDFQAKTKTGTINLYANDASTLGSFTISIKNVDKEDSTPIWIKQVDEPATIYYWIERSRSR